jgi:hypothetical protein
VNDPSIVNAMATFGSLSSCLYKWTFTYMWSQEISWFSPVFYLYARMNRVWPLSLDMVRDSAKDNPPNSNYSAEIAHVGMMVWYNMHVHSEFSLTSCSTCFWTLFVFQSIPSASSSSANSLRLWFWNHQPHKYVTLGATQFADSGIWGYVSSSYKHGNADVRDVADTIGMQLTAKSCFDPQAAMEWVIWVFHRLTYVRDITECIRDLHNMKRRMEQQVWNSCARTLVQSGESKSVHCFHFELHDLIFR